MKVFLRFLFVFCWPMFILAQNSYSDLGKENWKFRKEGDAKWSQASVPGTVHTDLLRNKMIPDPFFGANEKELQWIENEDWEYETSFTVSAKDSESENIELQFDGLDTYAEVFLNGKSVLKADNMFRTWKVEVKNYLKQGENKLQVVFQSAVKKGKKAAKNLPYTLPGDEKIFSRKAQYQYGWDWGPRFVTAGIWKKVQLHFWNSATIENIKYEQKSLTDEKAELIFDVVVNSQKAANYQLTINEKSVAFLLKNGKNNLKIGYEIRNPKRWWSNGLGEAYLYPFAITLSGGTIVLDKKELNIGLRTIELV
ncbi:MULTISPECIES: glycosyl hydrolase 2 galactose-binding domain-containing protein [Flavobacterium]|uniref:glycosyl hydrolase 2 galactose-binding domain-containing protein n=1 Tax=Flavobacterium TaxID=237 RepID=UPI001FCAD45F|nr:MULTISPECIES: sugar-binding domain-containing protein [Flavobacterium]UOK43557.1 hypothetical protein LZF87_05400 [Flavobacterium enshiense]